MISTSRIEEIVRASLFTDEEVAQKLHEDQNLLLMGEGVMHKLGFHRHRLSAFSEEIKGMLAELPPTFRRSGGGGMSFLNSVIDVNGDQWGEQRNADLLFTLGNALGLVTYPLPRDVWSALPGGVPYVTIEV